MLDFVLTCFEIQKAHDAEDLERASNRKGKPEEALGDRKEGGAGQMGEENMNWFEDDNGQWWNLDKVKQIFPPQTTTDHVEIVFVDDDDRFFPPEEWPRLRAQLLNSQRPADRRPEQILTAHTETSTGSQYDPNPKENDEGVDPDESFDTGDL
jgi:hypothetical protein